MAASWCALSVDLDEISHYRSAHGLAPAERSAHAVYDVALERVADFAATERLPVTLFAVGQDLERPAAAARLARCAAAGLPVENHSMRHRYDLTRLGRQRLQAEVLEGHRAIERCTGRAPVGFRAPGYTVSDELLDVLDQAAYRFDSSVFPCPPYYAAKALVMAGMRLAGRRSAAVLDTPQVWRAPRQPYRPSRPWFRPGGTGLVELPILVTPRLRLPVIGTSLALAGPRLARAILRRCRSLPFVGLELHGIDFLEAADGLRDLARVQVDLRIPVTSKLAVLRAVLAELRDAGRRFATLAEVAEALPASGGDQPA
ncbi:MAG: polysaccharide deacetylase family protein [Deltaproteobacteria bacterium]|jgi:hypothetical protein|nr:polysaccharide deacetylase family protein [Deltaproteobacteria bacterium]MBW2537853.1 polysaccharide deacetylase family protein [Deltaproteobacteria bacterium]